MRKSSKTCNPAELQSEPFAARLRELMSERGESAACISRILNATPQTITNYTLGKNGPSMGNLVALSQHFGTTTDYLLGVSDVRTVSASMRAIVDYTGFSERAIVAFMQITNPGSRNGNDHRTAMNSFLPSFFTVCADEVQACIDAEAELKRLLAKEPPRPLSTDISEISREDGITDSLLSSAGDAVATKRATWERRRRAAEEKAGFARYRLSEKLFQVFRKEGV